MNILNTALIKLLIFATDIKLLTFDKFNNYILIVSNVNNFIKAVISYEYTIYVN